MGVAEFIRVGEIVTDLSRMCDVGLLISPNELVALVRGVDSPYGHT